MAQLDYVVYLLEHTGVKDKEEEIRLLGREKVKIGFCSYKHIHKQEKEGFTLQAYWSIKADIKTITKYLFVLLMFCIKRHFIIVMNSCPIQFFMKNYNTISRVEFWNIAEWLGLH